jgi:endonuclease/exonuclease/phosphatase family metal-dependent hydrolase
MPPFPKPSFPYAYQLDSQLTALRTYRDTAPGRKLPTKRVDRLVVMTWNLANLGVQERRPQDYRLIAEILSWCDIAAIEEVNDDLTGLRDLQAQLPAYYRVLFSDPAGNNERVAFLYDERKVTLGEEVGEVAVPPSQLRYIRLTDSEQRFEGFDRNPYIALFSAGTFSFQLVGVHLFFGSSSKTDMNRRALETLAVARWASYRENTGTAVTQDIVVLGDFNLPKAVQGDPIFDQLTARGLELPAHSSAIGSAIASDSHYDQIAFFPGATAAQFTGQLGVFDFDGALFKTLWESRSRADFLAYLRYYVSDHRPMWAEFAI